MNQPILMANCLNHPAHGLRYVEIVVHNQNLQRRVLLRRDRPRRFSGPPDAAGAGSATRRRSWKELPLPGPALSATIAPPCISTSCFTSARPI